MTTTDVERSLNSKYDFITLEDIKCIILKCNTNEEIENYYVYNASNVMLGFLADYLKVRVHLVNQKVLYFFVKAISRTNVAKAEMVKEMKLFDKESLFYSMTKRIIEVPGIKPWSPRLITILNDAMVFEDLNAAHYTLKNKFERFDMKHTLQALKTLARFHACSIIFEENKRKETCSRYTIKDDYAYVMDKGGYHISCEWYSQCMTGALEAIKTFSKYNITETKIIENRWLDIWTTALDLNNYIPERRHVLCHRDLWNNNIMFHYKKEDVYLTPDDCVFVDFQAFRYQPPASDVMLLLYCNLDPEFRKENLNIFLDFYYDELRRILEKYNIEMDAVMTKSEFLTSAEEQIKWGLVLCACLIPQFWIDDELTTKIFSDTEQFDLILCKSKGIFIKKMMKHNLEYRQKVMEIFEEIADRYCFTFGNK